MAPEVKERFFKALMEWKAFSRELAGFVIFAGFFGALWMLLVKEVPTANRDVLMVLLGVLASSFKDVVGFLWGGSFGSEKKSDTLKEQTEMLKEEK